MARLYIKNSNNYKSVFNSVVPKDKWDDTNCKFNQMGIDKTNPQNLSKCVFVNSNYLKDYVNTWKTDVYNKVWWGDSICEHHSFCKEVLKYGKVIINPMIKTVMGCPKKKSYLDTEKFLLNNKQFKTIYYIYIV